MFSTICAFTPDRGAVFRYDGAPDAWTEIAGFQLSELYGGEFGLVGTAAASGDLLRWRRRLHAGVLHAWHPTGGPGATFAVTGDTVYGLTPNHGAVFRYDGPGPSDAATAWTQVGGGAAQLYGGSFGLVATDPTTGDLFRYLGSPGNWEFIGGPGAAFAVTADTVYGLTPDRSAVFRYDGFGSSWTRVGGPANELYGGDFGLVATSPENGNLFRHLGGPDNWQLIGGPGAAFTVTRDTVFGLTPDKGAVFRYDGFGTSWTRVGGPADAIVAFAEEDTD
jgi:hypothetical protein